jgi:hypothetical protein
MSIERQVDHSAIRTNQVLTIGLLGLAFVLDLPALAALTGAVMLVSALAPAMGLFTWIYRRLLRPAGLVRPHIIPDNPEPHRFAQLVGATCVWLAVVLVAAGLELGWALVGLVIVLAGLNLLAGWCAGCTLYYWLHRLGVPGFSRSPIEAAR